jgi:DNA-directed RNA polymerase II subunit RPB2
VITARIPYIKDDVPIAVLFRALGCISDRQIMKKVCYDPNDSEMRDALRYSLE